MQFLETARLTKGYKLREAVEPSSERRQVIEGRKVQSMMGNQQCERVKSDGEVWKVGSLAEAIKRGRSSPQR
jgi:hypothetical protein